MSQRRFEEQQYNTTSLDLSLWKKIFKLLSNQKRLLYRLWFFSIIVSLVNVLYPYMNKQAIDYYVNGQGSDSSLTTYILIFVLLVVIMGVASCIFLRTAGTVEMNFSYDNRTRLIKKLQELSYQYYDRHPNGWIMARISSDCANLSEIVSWGLMDLVWGLAQMVATTVIMLVTDWHLACIVFVTIPPLAIISVYFQRKILSNYREVRRINSAITNGFSEGIAGAKTTKTLVLEESNFNEFKEITGGMYSKSVRSSMLSAIFYPLVYSVSALSLAGILSVGGYQVQIGTMSFGTLYLFIQYSTSFFEPLRDIARVMAEFTQAQASAERVLGLLEEEPAIVDKPEVIEKYGTVLQPKKENYEPLVGHISFEHVDFHYLPEEPILKDFNLDIQPGQMIALVGETGSGKSTIVNMLCRFYEPVKGSVLIDGVDYRERSLGWLHENLGYVLQSPVLFSGTIKDNIRYGKLDATDEEVIEAAKTVNAHEFIMKLEKGYDTEVGEDGGRLSTGEKQLISFARAIIRKPSIFVLDEATSSIDTETEQIIQHAIETLLKGHTSFVIAHRLSTIVSADRILVIRKGRIEEDGTHNELMAKKGYYYRLYTNQFNEELQNEILKIH